jgi:hypothetical protein
MPAHILPVLLLLASWPLFGSLSLAQAQTASAPTAEPHHHLLLENDAVRVFALTLKPSEQAYARYDHNFLLVALEDCEMVLWSEGQSPVANFGFKPGDVHFLYSGPPRGFRNDRTTECRSAIVEFLDPKVTTYGYQSQIGRWDYGASGIAPPPDPEVKFVDQLLIGTAAVKDVQLLAGDSFPPPGKGIAELLIPVSDVDFKTQSDVHVRKASGKAIWMGAGRTSDLTNASGGPVRFVVVELPAGATP